MIWEIELLYFAAMIVTFIVLLVFAKMPSGIALMCSAVVGMTLGAIFSGTGWNLRYLIEGGFGYFDTILVIVTAMLFISGLKASGAIEYISVLLVKVFRKVPTVLLLTFILIVMLPGMLTGSSLASIVSCGAIVAPIMLKMGIPKKNVGAIIAFGAVLGMIAPPINVPVMVICDVVDIPYSGFTLPLICLTFPIAIFAVLWLSRRLMTSKKAALEMPEEDSEFKKDNLVENIILTALLVLVLVVMLVLMLTAKEKYANLYLVLLILISLVFVGAIVSIWVRKPYSVEINLEKLEGSLDFNITKELNPLVLLPVLILIILFVLQSLLPRSVGMLGSPLLFVIAFIPTIFVGRKCKILSVVQDGIGKSLSAMGLLIGVGMFVEVMTLTGARGYFVINALSLPMTSFAEQWKYLWQYISIVIAVPIFGGISAFGSASILGGPFVMALIGYNEIVVSSAISLVAAIGEFLPPTAMSATFVAKTVNEADAPKEIETSEEVVEDIQKEENTEVVQLDNKKKDISYFSITKTAIVPIVVTLVYALCFIMFVSVYWPE